jgi:hypothetical protein
MGNKSSNSRARGPQQYQAMVEDAVSALKEHPGSTQAEIFKYLENKYSGRITPKVRKILQNVLKSVIRTKPVHRGPRSLARGSKMKRKPGARGGAPRGRGGGPGRASAGRKAGPVGSSGRNLKKIVIKKNKFGRGNFNKKQKLKPRNLKMSGRKLKLSPRGNGAKAFTRSYHKSERLGRPSALLNPRLARDSSRASGRASNRASARPSRHNSTKSKLGRGGQRHRSVKVVTCCQRRVVSGRGRH